MQIGGATRVRRVRRPARPAPPPVEPAPWRAPERATRGEIARLLLAFAISRILVAETGVAFSDTLLKNGWQVLDVRLLHDDLFRSVWNLHSQPPLFNLFLGGLVHLPGSSGAWANLVFLGIGVALALGVYLLTLELGAPQRVAWVGALVFALLPSTIAYENFLFYTYLVAAALCWGCLAVARYVRTRQTGWGAAATSLFAVIALTRASYHLLWLVLVVGVMLVAARPTSRRALVVLLLPLLVVTGWYVKTYVMFGQLTASSWAGMNMSHVVVAHVPKAELRKMVERGELSPYVLHGGFNTLHAYGVEPAHTGVPALDEPKQSSGYPNYNNEAYIKISSQLVRDNLEYARAHPTEWLGDVTDSFRVYFLPAQQYSYFGGQLQTRWLAQMTDRFPLDQLRPYVWRHGVLNPHAARYLPQADQIAWLVVAQYAAVFLLTPVAAWAFVRRRGRLDPVMVTGLVIGLTVWWTMFVDNVFDFGENNRFRYETDAIVWALSLALVVAGVQRLRARRAPKTATSA